MKKALFLFVLFAPAFLFSQTPQTDANACFLSLTNGKFMTANTLKFEESYYKGGFLLVDGKTQVNLGEVEYYQNTEGYFRQYDLNGTGRKTWFKREEVAKLPIYSRLDVNYRNHYLVAAQAIQSIHQPYAVTPVLLGPSYNKTYYFQSGNNAPQKFTYANLANVVNDNPKSLQILNKGHNAAIARTLLWIAGATMLTVGAVRGTCNTDIPGQCAKVGKKGQGLALAGLVTCLVPLVIPNPKVKYRESVYFYNKEEK